MSRRQDFLLQQSSWHT